MANLMTNIKIAYVIEVITKNGKPTLELRIRVPGEHDGLLDQYLPIAKPIIPPGAMFNIDNLYNHIDAINKVYIIYENGNPQKPLYLGLLNDSNFHEIDFSSGSAEPEKEVRTYASKANFPLNGIPETIYIALDTYKLYIYENGAYKLAGSKDTLIVSESTPDNTEYNQWFRPLDELELLNVLEPLGTTDDLYTQPFEGPEVFTPPEVEPEPIPEVFTPPEVEPEPIVVPEVYTPPMK